MASEKRVTMRDIAAKAGVSLATVSMALKGNKKIAEATANKIRKIAEEMGYEIDPMLASLSSYRWNKNTKVAHEVIAWIDTWDNHHDQMDILTFKQYWEGALERATALGYKLERFCTDKGNHSERSVIHVLKSRGVRGIILSPQQIRNRNLSTDWKQFSAIRIGYSTAYPQFHIITSAQMKNMQRALFELVKRGYKRIGFMGVTKNPNLDEIYQNMLAAYLIYKHVNHLGSDLEPLVMEDKSIDNNIELIQNWVEKCELDCILAHNTKALELLKACDIKCPEEVGLATILDYYESDPPNSGVAENNYQIGATAVDEIVKLLYINESGLPDRINHLLVSGFWMDGATTRTLN